MAKTATASAKSKPSKRPGKPVGDGDTHGNITQATWFEIEGSPFPLGVTWIAEQQAYNFSLASKHAGSITLLLYDEENTTEPLLTYCLDPAVNKSSFIWHCRVNLEAAPNARYYAYSVDGSSGATGAAFFDVNKILLDPYAHKIHFPASFDREAARHPGSNAGRAPLGVLPEKEPGFDWGRDRSPSHGADTVIYEMHVRGFTNSPGSGVDERRRGTFAGVIEKIPYLRQLGVTAVELMPVQQFDPLEGNFWGYMTLNFFCPHDAYASDSREAKREFQQMVKALHEANIEVLLDVVYNHTAEADQRGPNYSFKGIDGPTYYLCNDNPEDPYMNFSGTGNTLNCADPYVRTMVVDSLRYWVTEMHVDGFRFDLASVFARNVDGSVNWVDPPIINAIRTDPVLRNVHLVAEPWDAGGLYQLGTGFPGQYWHQWNGKFRDEVRQFVIGRNGLVPALIRRLYGSDDLFPDDASSSRRPFESINYVVSHDGFTLYDLVSYEQRNNRANGHDNLDGTSDEHNWNCGWEGDTDVPAEVITLRKRQVKNFFCLLMLSNGLPMFRAGDEFLQTQGGNNNPYNQDNETSWLDWGRLQSNPDIFRFFQYMIAFRKAHPSICRGRFWRDDVRWYGVGPQVDMSSASHSLAFCLHGKSHADDDIYAMINAYWEPLTFEIQEGVHGQWKRVIDTSLEAPHDICESGAARRIPSPDLTVDARSIVVLLREKSQGRSD